MQKGNFKVLSVRKPVGNNGAEGCMCANKNIKVKKGEKKRH